MRGANICQIRSFTDPLAADGTTHTDSLNLGTTYSTSNCTGPGPYPVSIHPSKDDTVTIAVITRVLTDSGTVKANSVVIVNTAPTATVSPSGGLTQTVQYSRSEERRVGKEGEPLSLHYEWKNGTTVVRDVTKSAGTSADLTDSLNLDTAVN